MSVEVIHKEGLEFCWAIISVALKLKTSLFLSLFLISSLYLPSLRCKVLLILYPP